MPCFGFGYWGGWAGWLGPILSMIFFAIIIIGIVFLVRWLVIHNGSTYRGDSSLEILKMRYAKGDINREEFEEKRKNLL
jgi:putative membrane protein